MGVLCVDVDKGLGCPPDQKNVRAVPYIVVVRHSYHINECAKRFLMVQNLQNAVLRDWYLCKWIISRVLRSASPEIRIFHRI